MSFYWLFKIKNVIIVYLKSKMLYHLMLSFNIDQSILTIHHIHHILPILITDVTSFEL